MKLVTRHDLEMPVARAFDALCDTERWERLALRRGAEVRRDAPQPLTAGATWRCGFTMRGRARDLTLRLTRLDPPGRLDFAGVSKGYEATVSVELVALSPKRTRITTRTDLRATTLPTRVLLQSARLAKARLQLRLQARVARLIEALG